MDHPDISTLDDTQKRELLAKLLRKKAEQAGPRKAPLSHAQQRLWFIDQMQTGNPVYTIAAALRLTGTLDRDRLQNCLNTICDRHEALRTRFAEDDGVPVQVIKRTAPLPLEDMVADPATLNASLKTFAGRPFDLTSGPLLRCALVRLGEDEHVLALAAHHIIADYRSLQVMISEFSQLYAAPETEFPPLSIQYADYAIWQNGRTDALEQQVAYWHDQFAGLPALLDMPTDFQRPALPSGEGARYEFSWSNTLSTRIEEIARHRGMTPFMVLLALFQLLHHRYCGARDICIGTTVSNRDRAELQGMIGYFVNTLAIRTQIASDDTLDSLLDRVRDTVIDGMAHQEAPFEQVVDGLDLTRSLSHSPVFQSMFNLHEKQPSRIELAGLTLSPVALGSDSARFDLALDMFRGETLTGVLEYSTDLYAGPTIARMAQHFEILVQRATDNPTRPLAEIDIRTEDERAALTALNHTESDITDIDLASLIETTSHQRGEATAIVCGDRSMSFAELNSASNRLAHLIATQIGTGDRVAVCLPRTEQMVIALLAVLKRGATYIPLDPKHPQDRLLTVLEDSGARLVILNDYEALAKGAPCATLDLSDASSDLQVQPETDPGRSVSGDHLAYIIFTSGTTGRPKGVPIRQRSLVNLLTSMARTPGMSAEDTLVAVTTPAFDIAGLELFLPLLTGGRLVIADEFAGMDDLALSRLLSETDATMMQATPTTWRLLCDGGWRAPGGFRMLCGGEALDPALAARLVDGGGTLWNMYGPTETTIWSSCTRITPDHCQGAVIPLGAPIANTTLHVLDEAGLPCPTGVAGELFIGGEGLSPGYLDRPELTEKAFMPNPFGPGRLYRTGDSVRRAADGSLIYLGRLDFQVKLRGFRIELAEIETVLHQHPNVEQAVVTLQKDGGEGRLVAYCRASGDDPGLEPGLRALLSEKLPTYMVPGGFMFLDRFPLNANGKVDRKALPPLDNIAPEAAHLLETAPTTPTESFVARIWGPLLNLPNPGRETEFFAAGGHSLLAMRMIARLPLAVPRAVPLRLLFEHPVLKDFAAALDIAGALDAQVSDALLAIPHLSEATTRPLSYAQKRQWALARFDPGSPAYNLPAAIRLRGPLDIGRLTLAFELLIDRHDILRTAYPTRDGKASVVQTHLPVPITHHEASDPLAGLQSECGRPFDLDNGPLLRLSTWKESGNNTVLLLVMHHIISDALSVQLVLRELIETYTALSGDAGFTPDALPVRYADFAAWELTQNMSKDLDYWHAHLADAPPLLELPTDHPRRARQEFHGGAVRFTIAAPQADALRKLGQRQSATPYMVMLSGFAALLGRYSGMTELVIGTPVAQRPHPDLEPLVGLFVNTLALRLPGTSGDPFTKMLEHVRETLLAGFEHQDVPFERVVDRLSPERSQAHNPIFQAMFQWKTRSTETPVLPEGLSAEPLELGAISAKVDITLAVEDSAEGFACRFEFRTDLFDHDTIEHMALTMQTLLEGIIADAETPVDQLPLLHADQAAAIARWNNTARTYPAEPATLHDLVSARAARDGAAVAIRDRNGALSYAELAARSDTLAAHLQSRGIGRETRVGIALPRDRNLICAILAVLKTGAAYVPLDPRYPTERIAEIAEDADLALILTAQDGAPETGTPVLDLPGFWPEATPALPTPSGAGCTDLAYLIYTSGSTGRPKGVALEHRNAVALIHWAQQAFSRDQMTGVLASTSVCFDLSVFEIFATLSAGGTILLVNDLFDLPDAPFADQVTLINTVPTPMAELMRLGPLPANARTICLAGEPLPLSLAESILHTGTVETLWNLYGPSEDTTYSTGTQLRNGEKITIGAPLSNTRAYVLDAHGHPLPPGIAGELWLAGDGVARGYWRRPDLTAERFVPDPFDETGNAVMYHTGDRVRRLPDGQLNYLGRGDRQVKVRGFRIEPGEVETAILHHPDVSGAVVDLWQDAGGNGRLAAWIETDAAGIKASLSQFLGDELPAHMVPTIFVPMQTLPRLPNGKLNRKALPEPQPQAQAKPVSAPPQGDVEQTLAAIWEPILGRTQIGRADNFFALGGDSILAIQVVAQARQQGLRLSPRDLFQYPTVETLAKACAERTALPNNLEPVEGQAPMTAIQRWFLDRDLPQPAHWNQALVLRTTAVLDADLLDKALATLAADHDVLRARFQHDNQGWQQVYLPVGEAPRLTCARENLTDALAALQSGFDLTNGPLWGAVLADHEDGQRLALAAHHLLVDGVSWRVLLADLQAHYQSLAETGHPAALPRSNGVGDWVSHLTATACFNTETAYWSAIDATPLTPLPQDKPGDENTEAASTTIETVLDEATTAKLLSDVPASYPAEVPELLTAALFLAIRDWTGQSQLRIEIESHGRADLTPDLDLSRTVGWLTGLYPVLLGAAPDDPPDAVLLSVKENLRRVPNHGIGYGVLRNLRGANWPKPEGPAAIRFNYLGQTDALFGDDSLLIPADEPAGTLSAPKNPRDALFDINAIVGNGRLRLRWTYPGALYDIATVETLAAGFTRHLDALIQQCLNADASGLTPADFPEMDFAQDDLDDLLMSL